MPNCAVSDFNQTPLGSSIVMSYAELEDRNNKDFKKKLCDRRKKNTIGKKATATNEQILRTNEKWRELGEFGNEIMISVSVFYFERNKKKESLWLIADCYEMIVFFFVKTINYFCGHRHRFVSKDSVVDFWLI